MSFKKVRASMKRHLTSTRTWVFIGVLTAAVLVGGVFYLHRSPENIQPQQSKPEQVAATPAKSTPLSLSDFHSVIATARPSIVKIKGEGCGGIINGTGFVVAPDLVATNAHAVAGISNPHIIDSSGDHAATTIWFDPDLDFAILRATRLAGKSLPLDIPSSGLALEGSHNSERTVMLGYPGGDNFKATLADIKNEYTAQMYDIFGEKLSFQRGLFSLDTEIVPGNSGSPIIQLDGRVAGIVFGADPTAPHTGLALPTIEISGAIQQAKSLTSAVDTRSCAAQGER